jgi:hypothetical protein
MLQQKTWVINAGFKTAKEKQKQLPKKLFTHNVQTTIQTA